MESSPPSTETAPAPASRLPRLARRRELILDRLLHHGEVRVADLAADYGVSEVTIRTDLAHLEGAGLLVRDHGGASPTRASRAVTSLAAVEQRAAANRDAKRRIAAAAAKGVRPGETIILDAGTTVVEMAAALAKVAGLRVVTNALNVAYTFGSATDATVVLLGGTLHRDSGSLLGPPAEAALRDMTVDTVYLGAQALDLAHGVSDTTLEIAHVKRAMIHAAKRVVLLVDATKWDSSGFIKVAPLTEIDQIITDRVLDAAERRLLDQAGVDLLQV